MNPLQRLRDDRLVIFLFHGVIEGQPRGIRNSSGKHLDRDRFIALMSELKRRGQPMGIEEVVEHHRARRPFPSRAFAITFDDGFENNCSVAAPILSDLKVPATFYITTGFVEDNSMSWIDRIEHGLDSVDEGRFQLPWSTAPRSFRRTEEKLALLEEIRHHAKRSRGLDLSGLADEVLTQCGVQELIYSSRDPLDLKMTWEQVCSLADHEGFTIGGHTHTHANLAFCSPAELEQEITTSLDLLQQRAGIQAQHYSYPEGLEFCYSQDVIGALSRHGIICCPTAEDGDNGPADDLFRLRRVSVV